jgi:hypothetical protein
VKNKMEDVSNKTIVALLAIALVITVVGTVVSVSKLGALGGKYSVLSGAATTGSGTTTVTLAGTAAFVLDDAACNYGSGYVTEGSAQALLDCQLAVTSWVNWTNTTAPTMPDGMLLNNTGTTPLKVNISSGNQPTAEAWLCPNGVCTSNTAQINVKVANKETSSCTASGSIQSAYTNLMTNAANISSVRLCSEWDYNSPSDTLDVYFQAIVPNDALTGVHNVRVDFTACDSTIC